MLLMKLLQEKAALYSGWLKIAFIVGLCWIGGWGFLAAYLCCVTWGFKYRVSLYRNDIHAPEKVQRDHNWGYNSGRPVWMDYFEEEYTDNSLSASSVLAWVGLSSLLIVYSFLYVHLESKEIREKIGNVIKEWINGRIDEINREPDDDS